MRKLIIDVENTTTKLNDKYVDYSPYNPSNRLVSIGWAWLEDGKVGEIQYLFMFHNELKLWNKTNIDNFPLQSILLNKFEEALQDAEVIIAHNAKYDCQWLLEAGFKLEHCKLEDTMIREYVMARGRSDFSFRLADTAKRYGVAEKGEIFDKYPDMQISEMPIAEVEDYGRGDIQSCGELYLAQEERLNQDSYKGLRKTIDMMNEFCKVLVSMERAGVKIDDEALKKVEAEFTIEAEQLKHDLYKLIRDVMGDTPINLDSPQQLSEVIYSRKILAGKEDEWITIFNIGKDDRNKHLRRPKMSYTQYAGHVKSLATHVLKTSAAQCPSCVGKGYIQKIRKDGSPFKNTTRCKTCDGIGVIYVEQNIIAGFKMKPMNIAFTTVSGFSTSKTFLEELIAQAEASNKPEAVEFLTKLQRLSSISSYLSNFVGGITTFKQANNILHTNFNQCITATGRLSSTKPNLQNQPREATFPIRSVFVSRFNGGKLIECDYAQLEFRAAVHLAKCVKGKEDILDGKDIHIQTANILTEAGQKTGRQAAKSRSFKPLFGGSSGTEAERRYYSAFLREIYKGIGRWHKELEEEAISQKMITVETGRQFLFGDVERQWHGGPNRKTQIVNYPVQSFATADLLPISIIRLNTEMQKLKLKSILILSVHDSVTVDTIPEEIEIISNLLKNLGKFAEEELKLRYNIDPFVPFTVEVKVGDNLMDMKKAV